MSTEPETIPAPTLANQVNLAQIPTQQDKDELVAVTTGMPPLARPPPSDIGSLSSSNPTGRIPRTSAAGALLTGAVESNKIYVGGLPVNATIEDLQDCFGQMGECTCILKSGFGFVEYKTPAHAAEAVAKYHEGHFLGAQIKVELSHARAPPSAYSDGSTRFPPGSDRPSDPRKPMHINGPPGGQGRGRPGRDGFHDRRGPPPFSGPHSGPPGRGPPGYGRDPYHDNERFDGRGPYPPRDFPPYGGDRYRGDPRGGPPPGPDYPDTRYTGYGPPPSNGYGSDAPPAFGRDGPTPRFDPYYNNQPAPPPNDYYATPRGGPGLGPPPREPYAGDRFDSRPPPMMPPPFDGPPGSRPGPYDSYGPPQPYPSPRGAGGDDRGGSRYNPYGRRSPPPSREYGGRSPRGGPIHDRRRSLSPRRGPIPPNDGYRPDYPPPSFPLGSNNGPSYANGGGGYAIPPFDAPRGGFNGGPLPPRGVDEYNPRR